MRAPRGAAQKNVARRSVEEGPSIGMQREQIPAMEEGMARALEEEGVPEGTVFTYAEIRALFDAFLADLDTPEMQAMDPQLRNRALYHRHRKLALSYMNTFQRIALGQTPRSEVGPLLETVRQHLGGQPSTPSIRAPRPPPHTHS